MFCLSTAHPLRHFHFPLFVQCILVLVLCPVVETDGHGTLVNHEASQGVHGSSGSLGSLEGDGGPAPGALVVGVLDSNRDGVLGKEELLEGSIISGPGQVGNIETLSGEGSILGGVGGVGSTLSSLVGSSLVELAVKLTSLELEAVELLHAGISRFLRVELNQSIATRPSVSPHDHGGGGSSVLVGEFREGFVSDAPSQVSNVNSRHLICYGIMEKVNRWVKGKDVGNREVG